MKIVHINKDKKKELWQVLFERLDLKWGTTKSSLRLNDKPPASKHRGTLN